jgi:hypothetical protein
VVGADRQRAAGRRLGRDHAVGLWERAGYDERLARGQQVGHLLVLQPFGEQHALAQGGRGRVCDLGRRGAKPMD